MAKRIIFMMLACFASALAQAQDPIETAQSGMNSNGKIYVVIVVLAMILVGVLFYLVRLDIKLRRLENKEN